MTFKKNNKIFITDHPEEFGSIAWSIDKGWGADTIRKRHSKESNLRITDCYKVIVLEFSYQGYDEYLERIKKLDNLIEELNNFKEALQESWGKE